MTKPDMDALNACLDDFVKKVESLGGDACIASFVFDDDNGGFSGSTSGFGIGPQMMALLINLLTVAKAQDPVATWGAAQNFQERPSPEEIPEAVLALKEHIDELLGEAAKPEFLN